jgi:hypothetical protein
MYQIFHKTCGGVAFWYTEKPVMGQLLEADKAVFDIETMEHPVRGELIICQSCNNNVRGIDLECRE